MTWYIDDIPRLRREREGLETLAVKADWFTPLKWRMDGALRLVLDADIVVGDRTFPIYLQYPDMFPHSPPSVFPRGDSSRWSAHQFGSGGELCLEYGPDNWTPDLAGVQMMESAYRLLSQENPESGETAVVASRHAETLGQQLRHRLSRLLMTREIYGFFETIRAGEKLTGGLTLCYHEGASTYVVDKITLADGTTWAHSSIPKPLISEGRQLAVSVFRAESTSTLPETSDLSAFKTSCTSIGLEVTNSYLVLLRGPEVHFYTITNDTVSARAVIPPQPALQRLDTDHQILTTKSVALIGCGSLGSKVGTILARTGITRFFLVDDDILMPDNFVRHDLDWRDAGSHKANALARKMMLVNAAAQPEVWRARLGGQESPASAETMLTLIGDCDLIFDATANPDSLNLMSAITTVRKKPLVWAEIFGGGIGGLIARCRPDIEPVPQYMRRAIENWFGERAAPPVRSTRSYETGLDGPPLIADDADVTAIAAHAARLAIDVLIGRQPSLFPNSVYAIGLGVGSVFDQPFQTFPIEMPLPQAEEAGPALSPEALGEEVNKLMEIFRARANETASSDRNS